MDTVALRVNNTQWDMKENLDVENWFLMGSPLPLMGIMLSYLAFVLKLGPSYMKDRPPFLLKEVLLVYNSLQVVISCCLFFIGLNFLRKYGLIQNGCIMESEEAKGHIMAGIYYYLMAKVTELLDTIFFVLRKKYQQASFLHIYHHSITVIITWSIIKFDPTPIIIFLGTLNSFVHIVMYVYYALSAFPNLNKYLWWKAHITQLQLVQFVAIMVHVYLDYKYSQCKASFILVGTLFFNLILMIVLFSNFYIKSYLNKNTKKSKIISNESNTSLLNSANRNGTEKKKDGYSEHFTDKKQINGNQIYLKGKHSVTGNVKKDKKWVTEISNGSHVDKKIH